MARPRTNPPVAVLRKKALARTCPRCKAEPQSYCESLTAKSFTKYTSLFHPERLPGIYANVKQREGS